MLLRSVIIGLLSSLLCARAFVIPRPASTSAVSVRHCNVRVSGSPGRRSAWTALYFGTTGALALTEGAFFALERRLHFAEDRRSFLENIVVDGTRVAWQDCELTFAYSLKQDDRDWCFGLFDATLKRLLAGDFEPRRPHSPVGGEGDEHFGDAQALAFAQELTDSLSISATDFDDVATSLMIARIRENAEDEVYERGEEVAFSFGDAKAGISSEADRARREAIFKALCALRFVRLGLSQ